MKFLAPRSSCGFAAPCCGAAKPTLHRTLTSRPMPIALTLLDFAVELQNSIAVVLLDIIGGTVFRPFAGHFCTLDLARDFAGVHLRDLAGPGAVAPLPLDFVALRITHGCDLLVMVRTTGWWSW